MNDIEALWISIQQLEAETTDLAARLDAAEKRIGELEKASPCPMLKSICEDWEYTGKLDGTERIKIPISQPKFGPLLNDAKPSPEYCTCGETETWFDRSMTTDEQGNVIQDMCDRCVKCGKEKKYVPEPDDAEPSPDKQEMVDDHALQIFQLFRRHGEVSGVDFDQVKDILISLIKEARHGQS